MKLFLQIFGLIFLSACAATEEDKPAKSREIYLFHENGKVKSVMNYEKGNRPSKFRGFYISELVSSESISEDLRHLGFLANDLKGETGFVSTQLRMYPVEKRDELVALIEKSKSDSILPGIVFCLSLKPEKIGANPDDERIVLYGAYRSDNGEKSLPGWLISKSSVTNDEVTEKPIVNVSFTPSGASILKNLTGRNSGKQLAMIVGDRVISAPSVNGPIAEGELQISGSFSTEEAAELSMLVSSSILNGEKRDYDENGKLIYISKFENGEQIGPRKKMN